MPQKPLKICFVSVHTYPVINPQARGHFGGMETISWDFARHVAKIPGTEVSFAVTHRMAPRRSVVDQVNVVETTDLMEWYRQDLSQALHAWRNHRQIPSLANLGSLAAKLAAYIFTRPFRNVIHPQWKSPSRRLTDLNSDIYLVFGVNTQSACAMTSARSIHRLAVLCLMSDSDIDQRFRDDADFVNQYGVSSEIATQLIRHTDGIITQTPFQQQLLKNLWQRESTLISNPLDLDTWDKEMQGPPPDGLPEGPFVLWIGRADRFHKRPLEMLRTIKATPQIHYVMVLNPSDPEVMAEVKTQQPANLTIIPQVNTRQMAALMNAATVFATSSSAAFEGLPSVLLQAAAAKNPIVSQEVSAAWLTESGAGICVHGDRDAFARTITYFVTERDSAEVKRYAESGRRYVESEHRSSLQAAKLVNSLRELIESNRTTSSAT